MADILSQEEIDALLTGITEDEGDKEKDEGNSEIPIEENSGGRIITSYDFKHPQRVNKDQLRTLENLHDNFARLLAQTFLVQCGL